MCADELIDAFEADFDDSEPETGSVAFFPQGDLAELIERWPDLTEEVGATWDEHRRIVESTLVQMSEDGVTGLSVVPGSAGAFVATIGADQDDVGEAVVAYLTELEEPAIAWPPERNAPCWCGSGVKYKKCCPPRSRD